MTAGGSVLDEVWKTYCDPSCGEQDKLETMRCPDEVSLSGRVMNLRYSLRTTKRVARCNKNICPKHCLQIIPLLACEGKSSGRREEDSWDMSVENLWRKLDPAVESTKVH